MRRSKLIPVLFLFIAIFSACKKNKYLLSESKMENIIYDLYVGEAVIDNSPSNLRGEEYKRDLYLTVLTNNGVTEEQYDSSLVYYGQNVDDYYKIYDKVVARLEKDEAKYERLAAAEQNAQKSLSGDSIDIWNGEKHFAVLPFGHTQIIRTIPTDENFKAGDRFELNFNINIYPAKLIVESPVLYLTISYSDATVQTTSVKLDREGVYKVNIEGEKDKPISRISCYILPNEQANQTITPVIGKVESLIRSHYNEEIVNKRNKALELEVNDSI
ncbi:MAG: DUF4296 domain-containing protein [Bacteroidales bacterium]